MVKERRGGQRWTRDTNTVHIKGRQKTSLHLHLLELTTTSDQPVDFIQDLLQYELIHEVHSQQPINYFLYGVAKLYNDQLKVLPHWITSLSELSNRVGRESNGPPAIPSDWHSISELHSGFSTFSEYTEDTDSEDEEEDINVLYKSGESRDSFLNPKKVKPPKAPVVIETPPAPKPIVIESTTGGSNASRPDNISSRLISGWEGTVPTDDEIVPYREPVRVQPKTFFSNERTLLQWVNAIVFLATIALTLIGLGDSKARVAGFLLLPVSLLFGIYALGIYHIRLQSIQSTRNTKAYEDKFGPYFLLIVLLLALVAAAIIPMVQVTAPFSSTSKYPFVLTNLPYTPQNYAFMAPIPSDLFTYQYRTLGVESVLKNINTLALNSAMRLYFPDSPMTETNDTTILYSSLTAAISSSLYTIKSSSQAGTTTFSIVSSSTRLNDIEYANSFPDLRSLDVLPRHNPDLVGKEQYSVKLDCSTSAAIYSSMALSTSTFQTWTDVNAMFPDATSVLLVPQESFSEPLNITRYIEYKWSQPISIASTPATLSILVTYPCSQTCTSPLLPTATPSTAYVSLNWDENYRNSGTILSSRYFMEKFIDALWPSTWC